MKPETQAKVADNGQTNTNISDNAEVSSSNQVEIITPQDITVESSNLPITPIDVNMPEAVSTVSSPLSVTAGQTLPIANNQNDVSLIEVDKRNMFLNEKKLETFVWSLERHGGRICNEIIQVVNAHKRKSKGTDYEDLYENPIKLFKETYNLLKNQPVNLLNNILDSYHKVNNVFQNSQQIPLPLQFILGIMLRAYKESVKDSEFVKNIRNDKSISLSTCYNYINLTKVIDYIDDNRIFAIGLTNLYKLSDLLQNNVFGNTEIVKEILNLFYNLTNKEQALANPAEKLTDDMLQLLVEYIIFYFDIGKQVQMDRATFGTLYDARYRWTRADVDFVKRHSVAKDKNGEYEKTNTPYQYKLKNPNFMNLYMDKIIECNFNGKNARKQIQNKTQIPASPKTSKKSGNEYTINWATAHLTETLDKYLNDNKPVTPNDIEFLKNLQSKLNQFLAKNSTQVNGAPQ